LSRSIGRLRFTASGEPAGCKAPPLQNPRRPLYKDTLAKAATNKSSRHLSPEFSPLCAEVLWRSIWFLSAIFFLGFDFLLGDQVVFLLEDGEDCIFGLVRRNWHLCALPTILIYHHPYSESSSVDPYFPSVFSFVFLWRLGYVGSLFFDL
jgi:hypothetical protein